MTPSDESRSPPPPSAAVWIQQELAMQILREVVAQCDRAGIAVLPVKGVVTSHLLYPDVAQRPISDVDVRVRPRDLRAFEAVAAQAGWPCLRIARSYRNLVYDFPPLTLDVEGQIGPPGLCALSVETMLERADRLQLAEGFHVNVPELHDHALLLTVNAFKDKIATAAPHALEDLARVVSLDEFRPDVFVDRAVESRCGTITWLVASWMESKGHAEWARLRYLLDRRAPVRRGYARLFRTINHSAGPVAAFALRLVARAAADAPLMRVQAILGAGALVSEMWLRRRFGAPRPQ